MFGLAAKKVEARTAHVLWPNWSQKRVLFLMQTFVSLRGARQPSSVDNGFHGFYRMAVLLLFAVATVQPEIHPFSLPDQ